MNKFVIPAKQAVVLSDAAITHFSGVARGRTLKFGVRGGGCSGFQYYWKIVNDSDIFDDDELTEYPQFKFAVDGASLMMVIGSTVDYKTDLTGSHIVVDNPLTKASCGCGESVNF